MFGSLSKYLLQNQFVAGLIFIAIVWFLLEIKSILVAIFISYIIMAAITPAVSFLTKRKVPKILASALSYFTTLVFCGLLIAPLVPFFISQIHALFIEFPIYLDRAASTFGLKLDFSEINSLLTQELDIIGRNAISVTSKVFGGMFSVLTVLVVSFYLLIEKDKIKDAFVSTSPKNKEKILKTFSLVEERLGAWLRGQIILSLFIGVITWIALTLIGINVALPLALIAGILEIVPTIGPILSAIPAIIIALTISPTAAISVVIVYLIIQMLENNILVPKIMEKAVGLNPIAIIVLVMIGTKLMGVLGALLSIPFASMLIIIYNSIANSKKA